MAAEDLTLEEEIEEPSVKPGHVVVTVKALRSQLSDVLMIEGKYQSLPDFPFSPGGEFSGRGQRSGCRCRTMVQAIEVFASLGHGCFAEKVLVRAGALRAKPASMSHAVAAGISTTYGTRITPSNMAGQSATWRNPIGAGAAGGVGLAAVELGKAMGARVIAAASSDEKLAG